MPSKDDKLFPKEPIPGFRPAEGTTEDEIRDSVKAMAQSKTEDDVKKQIAALSPAMVMQMLQHFAEVEKKATATQGRIEHNLGVINRKLDQLISYLKKA